MRLSRIHWHDNANVYHRAHAACLLAQDGARVTTENHGETWRITWVKA